MKIGQRFRAGAAGLAERALAPGASRAAREARRGSAAIGRLRGTAARPPLPCYRAAAGSGAGEGQNQPRWVSGTLFPLPVVRVRCLAVSVGRVRHRGGDRDPSAGSPAHTRGAPAPTAPSRASHVPHPCSSESPPASPSLPPPPLLFFPISLFCFTTVVPPLAASACRRSCGSRTTSRRGGGGDFSHSVCCQPLCVPFAPDLCHRRLGTGATGLGWGHLVGAGSATIWAP